MKKLIAVLAGVLLLLPSLTMALEPFNKDLRYGMVKNEEVKRMQEFLRNEGLYTGPITGNYYALTRDAVRKYQKNNGIKVTGLFDKVTRSKVNEMGVAISETVLGAPVADVAPSIPLGWVSNGDGTWSMPVVSSQPVVSQPQTVVANQPATSVATSNPVVSQPVEENKQPEASITINRKNLYDNDELSISATNDDFILEALTITGSSKLIREKIVLNNYFIYNSENEENLYKNIFTSAVSFNIADCQSVNKNFKEFSSKEYPYPCTGKEYSIDQYNDESLPFGYTYSSVDWMGRRKEVLVEKSKRSAIFLPKLTTIEYIKFVGKNSGKVFEFRNI